MSYRSLLITGTMLLSACIPANPNRMGDGGMMQSSFLPARDKDINQLPEAKPMSTLEVNDGDTITLNPELVRASINGKNFVLYAYNGQFPGPTIKVRQGSTFTVNVTNTIDQPTTIHWHGIRLENRFDGAAGVTQETIKPGQSFTYTVTVPDKGLFWYHPHVREDLQQDMGLYGLLHVIAKDAEDYPLVHREEYLVLDDMLLDNGAPVPYGAREADHALMGRFGNVILTNGKLPQDYSLQLRRGSIVRYSLLNAANTRTFRIIFVGGKAKLVGGDAGRAEKEQWVDSVIIGPSERSIVEVLYENAGSYPIQHQSTEKQYLIGSVEVTDIPVITADDPLYGAAFSFLHAYADVQLDIDEMRQYFDKPVDKTIRLSVESMPARMIQQGNPDGMQHGGGHGESATTRENDDGIEWEDPMPHINAMSTKGNTQWKLIDEASAAENMDISYQFKVGDKVKIRLVNDMETDGSDHPMQHPIHFHGQRFLVLSVNGKENENLVWKDTVLVPKDATVDILLDVTNPGDWMVHCHIAEHLSNGMMGMFTVQ